MIKKLLLASTPLLLVAAGCGASTSDAETAANPATAVSRATPSPSVPDSTTLSATPSPATLAEAAACTDSPSAVDLSGAYELTKLSRGTSDAKKYAKAFFRAASDTADDLKRCNDKDLVLSSAALAVDAAAIQLDVTVGTDEGDDLREARQHGQELFDAFGIRNWKFGNVFS